MWRLVRRPPRRARQRQFGFRERSERLQSRFRQAIVGLTLLVLVGIVAATPAGRELVRRLTHESRLAARAVVGLPTPREEIDADWSARRRRGVEQASATFARVVDEASDADRRLLRFAGMDRDSALLRWGNYDRILVLPSAVFAPDDHGRSYRLKPNTRSIWLRGLDLTHGMNGFFLVPDTPELPSVLAGTSAKVVPGTGQSTNSWGCRGPEPDLSAPVRGIVLGDSFMQGYFVGDAETPPICLERELKRRLGVGVSVLNTGHLGYSPEQYYHALAEYADRLRPGFVLVAISANDFGEPPDKAGWDEGYYWLDRIDSYCRTRRILCVVSPVPTDHQIDVLRREGTFPVPIADRLSVGSTRYCFPVEDLVDEFVRLRNEPPREGSPSSTNPLYTRHLDDRHLSARGAEVWGRALGRRISGLLEMEKARGLIKNLSR
jgi:lysophospholipase L1-like esterase